MEAREQYKRQTEGPYDYEIALAPVRVRCATR
jgi:hypothetical protein